MTFARKSGDFESRVVCWGAACEGNFRASGWPPAKSILVPASECVCRCLEELREFFGHHATVEYRGIAAPRASTELREPDDAITAE
jgi:hypothetical protein